MSCTQMIFALFFFFYKSCNCKIFISIILVTLSAHGFWFIKCTWYKCIIDKFLKEKKIILHITIQIAYIKNNKNINRKQRDTTLVRLIASFCLFKQTKKKILIFFLLFHIAYKINKRKITEKLFHLFNFPYFDQTARLRFYVPKNALNSTGNSHKLFTHIERRLDTVCTQ